MSAVGIVICALIVVIISIFGVSSFLLYAEKRKAEKQFDKIKNEEVKKNEIKETLNGGNHHDNINNSLDLLRNNEK